SPPSRRWAPTPTTPSPPSPRPSAAPAAEPAGRETPGTESSNQTRAPTSTPEQGTRYHEQDQPGGGEFPEGRERPDGGRVRGHAYSPLCRSHHRHHGAGHQRQQHLLLRRQDHRRHRQLSRPAEKHPEQSQVTRPEPQHPLQNKGRGTMSKISQAVVSFLKDESGPTAVEYAVMLTLRSVVLITAITALGTNANNTFSSVAKTIG